MGGVWVWVEFEEVGEFYFGRSLDTIDKTLWTSEPCANRHEALGRLYREHPQAEDVLSG